MTTLRTRPSSTYLPPTLAEMRKAAKSAKLKQFSADLVEDLCNLASGGKTLCPADYRDAVWCESDRKLPPPDNDGDWKIQNSYTKNRQTAVQYVFDRGMKYQQAVCDFLQTVDLGKFPGDSPLAQAMNLLKLLSTQSGGAGGGEDGESLPIFTQRSPEELAKKFNDVMDSVESMDEAEKELLDTDLENESEKTEKKDGDLQKMKIAEDMTNGKDVWLKISRKLDQLSRMLVSKKVKIIPDYAGDEVRIRPIEHMGEINRLVKSEWSLPSVYRTFRVVTHASSVRERVRREEKRQLLYLIIDCSGSMDQDQRIATAGGVLMNRLKAVINGEAEVFARFFDSQLYEEHKASTAAEAKALINIFKEKNFSGGSTDITACAREAQKRIKELVTEGKNVRPELVVITDGDDQISLSVKDLLGTKMHAFIVGRSNSALTDLAIKTGGVGINNL